MLVSVLVLMLATRVKGDWRGEGGGDVAATNMAEGIGSRTLEEEEDVVVVVVVVMAVSEVTSSSRGLAAMASEMVEATTLAGPDAGPIPADRLRSGK